ncbi:MAG: TrpR YerC/YecD [Clostridia bacterium]|nr:TrpR YerC/YecD [Clostridia bacterium]
MSPHHTDATKRLFRAMLLLKTEEECAAFFDDICTIREIQDLSQRLEVAEMLKAGKNYQEISRATGASTATICRVNKCLNYGSDGYNTVLSRLCEEDTARNA